MAEETVSLKEHLLGEIAHVKELIDAKLAALEKATSLVAENMKQKFEDTNKWRDQSKDQTATYVTKDLYSTLEDRTKSLELSRAEVKGMATQSSLNRVLVFSLIGAAIGLIGITLSLIVFFRG